MNLTGIPALLDNYIWTLNDRNGLCIIVDPGEATPVINMLLQNNWQPIAILLTHHHDDHVGGVKKLLETWPQLVVYGPQEVQGTGRINMVSGGDNFTLLSRKFRVFSSPGHTLGHISYFSPPYLFCGDTMFSGGCGRLFEGTAEQMFETFQKINQLPKDTLICCAHEYTLSNLKFALTILPQDSELRQYYQKIKELRTENHMTLPTKLAFERKINLFLRTHETELQHILGFKYPPIPKWQVFARLRHLKDHY